MIPKNSHAVTTHIETAIQSTSNDDDDSGWVFRAQGRIRERAPRKDRPSSNPFCFRMSRSATKQVTLILNIFHSCSKVTSALCCVADCKSKYRIIVIGSYQRLWTRSTGATTRVLYRDDRDTTGATTGANSCFLLIWKDSFFQGAHVNLPAFEVAFNQSSLLLTFAFHVCTTRFKSLFICFSYLAPCVRLPHFPPKYLQSEPGSTGSERH